MRPLIFAAALLVAPSARAAEPDICAVVDRIVAGSRETPAFASLRAALERREAVVPGFDEEQCRVSPDRGIDCSAWTMDRTLGDWPSIAECSGALPVPPPERRRRGMGDIRGDFSVSGVRISFGIGCMICAGPAIRSFAARLEAQEPSGR